MRGSDRVGAVVNTARVPAGATVAVIGLGGVGLNALLGGLLVGAREVIAVDLSEDKLRLARQLGATATFNAGDAEALASCASAPWAASITPLRWPAR